MNYIIGRDIQKALDNVYRVYLCGNLKNPQNLRWIHDENIEIGLSYYNHFTADQPHYHSLATEYNYVISGQSKVLLLDEGKEFLFESGSLFTFPPMTRYASKHFDDTKILFIKSPGGNDKHVIDVDQRIKDWLSAWQVRF